MTPEQKKRTEFLLDESEGIRHFVKNKIVADPALDLATNEIIEAYALFCSHPDRGWYPNQRQAERQLPDIMLEFFKTTSSTNISRNNKKVRGYRNVTFIP